MLTEDTMIPGLALIIPVQPLSECLAWFMRPIMIPLTPQMQKFF